MRKIPLKGLVRDFLRRPKRKFDQLVWIADRVWILGSLILVNVIGLIFSPWSLIAIYILIIAFVVYVNRG